MHVGESRQLVMTTCGKWAMLPLDTWEACVRTYREAQEKYSISDNRLYLPSHSLGVSERADAAGALVNVYADAIEFVGPGWREGAMHRAVSVLWVSTLLASLLGAGLCSEPDMTVAGVLLLLLALIMGAGAAWVDRCGFRYLPVIFDRARRKVHVFRDASADCFWWRAKRCVDTYDWDQFEVHITAQSSWGRENERLHRPLMCRLMAKAVMPAEQGFAIEREVFLGFRDRRQPWRDMLERWEYVRRYMQHEIEAVPESGAESVLASAEVLGEAGVSSGPRAGLRRADAVVPADAGSLGADLQGIGAKIRMFFRGELLRVALNYSRSRPEWPTEILATLGEPVSREQLQAGWRDEGAAV